MSDWTRDHANFFRSIELTKSMMFFILLILVVVAAINLVATLVMIVKEKQTDIAILRTIGAAPGNVLRMFVVQGALIGLVGTLAGAALGWLLALNVTQVVHGIERLFGMQFPRCVGVPHERPALRSAASPTCCRCASWRCCSRRSRLSTPPGAPRVRCRPRPCGMNEPTTNQHVLEARDVRRAFRQGPIDLEVLQGREPRGPRRANASPSSAPRAPARPRCCRSSAASTGRRAGTCSSRGSDIHALAEKPRGELRNRTLGFVYQFHHLLPEFSALENVAMPLLVRREPKQEAEQRARGDPGARRVSANAWFTGRTSCRAASASAPRWRARW